MKRILLLLVCGLFCMISLNAANYSVYNLKVEHTVAPLGIVNPKPCFSWQINADRRGVEQTAYEILVADSEEALAKGEGNVWSTGKISSDAQVLVPFAGKALMPATTYYWKVRSWSNGGEASDWSEPTEFTTGLPAEKDWGKAKWIAMEQDDTLIIPAIHQPLVKKTLGKTRMVGMHKMPQFRKVVDMKKPVEQALLYICGLGHFDLFLNGAKVGDHILDPGWTKYDKEALYVGFDITKDLCEGGNVLGVMLGNGFYNIPRERYFKLLGSFGAPKMRLKLVVRYADGKEETIVSDKSWRVTQSPVTFSSIFGGENYNATMEQEGWMTDAKFDDKKWQKAIEVKQDIVLRPQINTEVIVRQVLPTMLKEKNGKGSWTYDLGQNNAGIFRIKVKGNRGDSIIFRPAELLNEDGTYNQKHTGRQHFYTYVLKGDGVEEWQPQFTFYGFRYIQVEGAVPAGEENAGGKPVLLQLDGLHLSNRAEEAGTFACSNPMYNKIHTLIDWAIRSNMQSVLTDCPHREKLGWQEQNHLMQFSLLYRYDLSSMYEKILNDLEASQWENGAMTTIAPEYVRFDIGSGFEDTPEWGSAAIICPWYIWQAYGDKRLIENHYPVMKKYMNYLTSRSKDHIVDYGLGDWYDIGPNRPGFAQLTSVALSATAIYYYDAKLMAEMARLIGENADSDRYAKLAEDIKRAYNKRFLNADGTYDRNSQTANAMTLFMGLADGAQKQRTLDNLIKDIESRNYALTAGDVGFRYLVQALAMNGRHDILYKMNSKYDVPGYGWQLAHGATALTESWQAYGNVSNNHLMLGHILEWLYGGVGGIRQADGSTAYREVLIDPQAVGDISSASTTYKSPYGLIRCDWQKTADKYTLRVEVPAGSHAIVTLPTADESRITEYGLPIQKAASVSLAGKDGGKSQWRIGSGSYLFEVKQ